jgi:pSer/pThr/pTyr-binding forkhead associated (FHA) protein
VSRFHAVLVRQNGRVILEDSGSENGCYVNGTRIVNSIVLGPGDEILIGKHQLVLSEAGTEEDVSSELVKEAKNDAWDASNTYFVGAETQAKMLEGAGAEPAEVAEPDGEDEPSLAAEWGASATENPSQEIEASAADAVIESAIEPIGDAEPEPIEDAVEEMEAWTPAASDAAEEGGTAETASLPEPSETDGDDPFRFGMEADLAGPAPGTEVGADPGDYVLELIDEEPKEDSEQAVDLHEPVTDEMHSPDEPIWHAALIIQNQGKLDRIISWDQDRLVAGRSRECEIFLDQPEISRRHAIFVREEGRYEVRDLDSINGILVNGEKTRSRGLELGDEVKIEGFELTFLLDQQPIASEIKTDALAAPVSVAAESRFNMTMIAENLPIGPAITNPAAEEPPALVEEEVAEMPEGSLFESDEAEEKNVVEVEPISPAPSAAKHPGGAVATDEALTFELRVRVEDLPAPLRAALADLDQGELRLPVEMVLKADD